MTEQVPAATGSTAQKKEPKIVQSRLDDDYDIDYEEEERLYIQKLEEEESRPRYAPSFNEFIKRREQARNRR
jgi:ATP/maltotriose-dependent transcriptional regulator MalT